MTGARPRSALVSSHELQPAEPLAVLSVAPQPHPAVAATPDQLAGTPLAARQHLVDQQIEAEPAADMGQNPFRPGHGERDAIAAVRPTPGAPHRCRITRGVADRAHAQPIALLRNDQVPDVRSPSPSPSPIPQSPFLA